jgi:hypothetical protein
MWQEKIDESTEKELDAGNENPGMEQGKNGKE